MSSFYEIAQALLNLVWFVMIAHVIMSWLINFQVLNLHQQVVAQVWYGLNKLLNPLYNKIRSFLPDMQGLDLAPLVALFGVFALRVILTKNQVFFH